MLISHTVLAAQVCCMLTVCVLLCGCPFVPCPPSGSCASCSTKLASYYCSICHLWDDEPGRAIYHCPFCNVCGRGQGLGVDFFHCMQCNACMSLSLFNTHTCRCAGTRAGRAVS